MIKVFGIKVPFLNIKVQYELVIEELNDASQKIFNDSSEKRVLHEEPTQHICVYWSQVHTPV